MPSSVELVRRFRSLRALVVGDAMLDSYLEGTAARLCSEGPVPVVRHTAEERVPGGAANAAANLRALGAEVMLVAVVGPDTVGGLLRAALRARGVSDAWLVEDPAASTLHKLRILANDQYVVRFDEGDTEHLDRAGRQRLLARIGDVFAQCDLVVIPDYRYGLIAPDVIARLRELRLTHRVPLVVDAKDVRRFHDAGATLITPNHLEARLAVDPGGRGEGPVSVPAMERVGRRLLELVDAEHAAITMAGDGVLVLGREGPARHLPAHPVAHANDVGAGDSFTAAAALALAAGADCVEAARIGIDAAGIAVTKRRTAIVRRQELLQRVSLRDDEDGAVHPRHALAALAARLERDRARGRTVVFTNGVFDILHAGHVRFLRRAKELGDVLVVGVNSDASVRHGSERRPLNSERDRLALVAALDPVDHAILFDEPTPDSVIRALRPDVHVKGGDYADTVLPEADVVREIGGRVVILPLDGAASLDGLSDQVLAMAFNDGRLGAAP